MTEPATSKTLLTRIRDPQVLQA